jgi:hypothetical protein
VEVQDIDDRGKISLKPVGEEWAIPEGMEPDASQDRPPRDRDPTATRSRPPAARPRPRAEDPA